MRNFDNMVTALESLQREGYTTDFELLDIDSSGKTLYQVEETIHFEDKEGSAETSTVLYVITTSKGQKGFLISADSIYKDDKAAELESLLQVN